MLLNTQLNKMRSVASETEVDLTAGRKTSGQDIQPDRTVYVTSSDVDTVTQRHASDFATSGAQRGADFGSSQ